jgi:hypothetical protein
MHVHTAAVNCCSNMHSTNNTTSTYVVVLFNAMGPINKWKCYEGGKINVVLRMTFWFLVKKWTTVNNKLNYKNYSDFPYPDHEKKMNIAPIAT